MLGSKNNLVMYLLSSSSRSTKLWPYCKVSLQNRSVLFFVITNCDENKLSPGFWKKIIHNNVIIS